ncbi:dienelactone hydrolase family protein [Pseudoduganella flava]|uniref:Dienelactone hydrolase n=1 Tax=Pseudoduganella flava TaxID=871742 RepID=A0A562PIX6_9BURK|nr:CocE/NonD family hydrolase [Pseudoduganella flava]QGZ41965.1 dienelactone hydrolase [Pseudoduganella flava]TWI44379.1 dienelactone hydrolase family protein [Pseudoduganella flava]
MPRLLIALLFCVATAAEAATSLIPGQGSFPVGLKVVRQYDQARVYKTRVSLVTGKPTVGERARPMQMLVWYPAARSERPVTLREYVATGATEDTFDMPPAEIRRLTAQRLQQMGAAAPAQPELAQPMLATLDAPARDGKYPVIVYAPSFSAPASENADLCEYLASHGYVVLASASQGARTRSMTEDVEGLESQVADIGYLIAHAATLPQADIGRIAAMGFSWGGLANVLAAARDDRIKALISLDGSVRYYPQMVDGGKTAVPYVTPARLPVPLLFVGSAPHTIEALNRRGNSTAYSLLNQMTFSDVLVATMHPMRHSDFAATGVRLAPDSAFREYNRDEVRGAYGWMARYVLGFLDAHLKNDAQARAFLANQPVANGAPKHTISLDARPGSGAPPTRENFASQLAERGFDKAFDIYNTMQARGATFKLRSSDINSWGYELLSAGLLAESVAIFEFGTRLLPTDANLYDSLGEAQAAAGKREDAVRSYRRSLELDPNNHNAVDRLKTLESKLSAR